MLTIKGTAKSIFDITINPMHRTLFNFILLKWNEIKK